MSVYDCIWSIQKLWFSKSSPMSLTIFEAVRMEDKRKFKDGPLFILLSSVLSRIAIYMN